MEKAIIFTLASALVGLFLSRLHFHFSFNLTISRSPKATRKGNTSREPEARAEFPGEGKPPVRSIRPTDHAESDLCSALVNLGVKRQKAVDVAKKAMQQANDFDSRLKWAVRNAAA